MTRGDWRDWRWDPTLFAGAAPHYERGRLPYAEGLAGAFADTLGLDGHGRLLDVGCGPGSVTLRLAHLFDEVVGLDADPGMLDEARRLAADQGVGNATWVQRRAEDIGADLGRFRVVTFAQSFHWIDRPRVASLVRDLLEPGGAVVHVDSWSVVPALDLLEDVRRRWLGPDRRAGQSIRNTSPDDEDAVFRGAGLEGPEVRIIPDGRTLTRTVDDLVHAFLSTSGGAPHLFGDRLDEFVAEARAALPPDGITVTLSDNRIRVWRVATAPPRQRR